MPLKILILFFTVFLTGCVETVVVGTVATGAYVMSDGSIFDTSQDSRIESSIEDTFKENDNLKNINVNSFNGRVLLTGYVRNNESYKKAAVTTARATRPGIEVIDEIIVISDNYSIGSVADSMISSQIYMKLKATSGVTSGNYKYDVVDGVVYIIGKASTKAELQTVANTISQIKGVKKVVSYVKVGN